MQPQKFLFSFNIHAHKKRCFFFLLGFFCLFPSTISAKEKWFIYSYNSKKVGYSHISYKYNKKQGLYYKKKLKSFLVQGKTEEEEVAAVLQSNYELQSARLGLLEEGKKKSFFLASGAMNTLQGEDEVHTLPKGSFYLHVEDFLYFVVQQKKLEKGKYYRSRQLASSKRDLTSLSVRFYATATRLVSGKKQSTYHFKVSTGELKNFWADAFVAKDGSLLRYQLGSFSIIQSSKEEALENKKQREPIPAPYILGIEKSKKLYLKISGEGSKYILNGDFQKIKEQQVILQSPPNPVTLNSKNLSSYSSLKKFSQKLPIKDSRVQEISEKASQSSPNPLVKARHIAHWVDANIESKTTREGSVLKTILGSNSSAIATVTLCLAQKIPTRLVSGLVYRPGAFHYDSWAEVHLDEKWYPLWRGGWGQGARFLKIFVGKEWSQISNYGKLSIQIHSILKKNQKIYLKKRQSILEEKNGRLYDHLLGISAKRPSDWAILGKNNNNNLLVLRSLQGQGPAIVVKVFPTRSSLSEILQSFQSKLGKKVEVLWSQPKKINGIDGLESALKPFQAPLIYRSFIGEKKGKMILAFLVVSEKELPQIESGFLNFVTSIQLLD